VAVPEDIKKISDTVWEIPATHKEGMRVPARVYATEKLLQEMDQGVFDQVTNVATLPGILRYAYCMPDGHRTFYSTAHGSGRTMSRRKARKQFRGDKLQQEMEARGIYVHSVSYSGMAEEAGPAYKDIDEVILTTELAGISKRVVRFVPIGNVKG
jgi:RNA-splicing ligase RtcB